MSLETDVSASMCVLVVLGRMDKERLSLLHEDPAGGKDRNCISMGMEILNTASQCSILAARYLAALQQLGGEDIRTRGVSVLQRGDGVVENDNIGRLADFQNGMPPSGIDPLDPIWGINLDFGNFDDWLSGAELLGDFSTSC